MSITFQSAETPHTALVKVFAISGAASVLVFIGLLGALGTPLTPFALIAGAALFVWLAFRYPMGGLGIFLLWAPVHTLAFLIAKFFGPSYIGVLEGSDRVLLLFLTFILWRKNGVQFSTPDWLLLTCFGLAAAHLIFSGNILALLSDFNFMIAYAAGRVAVLNVESENKWANRAVWTVAALAVFGMIEVFVIGEGPRTVLYLAVGRGGTQDGALDAAFHGQSYSWMRESSTMFGPLQFAPLCMAALIIWWVYSRKLLPGAMIAAGLICSVTRSAWLGSAVALSALAVLMGQTRRFLQYGAILLALFIAAIPLLGLTDYLVSTKTGQDASAQGHQESILDGIQYMAHHPLGVGPGNAGKFALDEGTAFSVENSYLTMAAEYGILTALCFVGFMVSVVRTLWRQKTGLAFVAIGIVLGFGIVMVFAALHDVFPLACWLWFPVGLAIRSASQPEASNETAIPSEVL
jgi:hypothetical protein